MRTRLRARSRLVATVAVLAAFALTGAACGTAEDAVDQGREAIEQAEDAARDTAQRAQYCRAALQVASAVDDRDWDRAISAGEEMVAHAPDEIVDEARTVLDGARRIRDGQTQVAQSQEFQDAAEAVRTFTRERCDPAS